jgi:hypothetical protein
MRHFQHEVVLAGFEWLNSICPMRIDIEMPLFRSRGLGNDIRRSFDYKLLKFTSRNKGYSEISCRFIFRIYSDAS